MKVLQIDSSILGDASISRQLTQAVVEQLQQKYARPLKLSTWIWQHSLFPILLPKF